MITIFEFLSSTALKIMRLFKLLQDLRCKANINKISSVKNLIEYLSSITINNQELQLKEQIDNNRTSAAYLKKLDGSKQRYHPPILARRPLSTTRVG